MSLELLKRRLTEKKYSGVYLFFGKEEYTKDHYSARLKKVVEDSAAPEFNNIVLTFGETTASDLYEAIDQLPMMSDYKLIEIKDFNLFMPESDLETYRKIFSDIPEYCIILIVIRSDEDVEKLITGRDKKKSIVGFLETIAENGMSVNFEPATPNDLAVWITRHFKSKSVAISPEVPKMMIEICGRDMYVLIGEIEKLCAYYKGVPLTGNDVEYICCKNETFVSFDLTEALFERNLKKAEHILSGLIANKVKPELIMSAMTKYFHDLFVVATGTEKGVSSFALSKKYKIPEWKVGRYINLTSRVKKSFFDYCITECYNSDYKLKTSMEDKYLIIKMLLSRIIAYDK